MRIEKPEARRRFRELVPEVTYVSDDDYGGVLSMNGIVIVDGEEGCIKVQASGQPWGKSISISGISTIDYCCYAMWAPERGGWYVLSAADLVRKIARQESRKLGTNPFASTSISLGKSPDIKKEEDVMLRMVHTDQDLREAVYGAIRSGRHRIEQILMERLSKEIHEGADDPGMLWEKYSVAVRNQQEETAD